MDIWHRFLLLLACIALARGKLRILDLKVPSTVENGAQDVVILDCDFEATKDENGLEVKWFYGEDEQIYQWIPKRSKPQALGSFKDRIDLSYKASNDPTTMYRALRIKDVTPELSGDYKCKITSFVNEDTATRKMIVYEPADEFEFIHMDEEDKVICTANGVYPEPELTITMTSSNGTSSVDKDTDGDGIPDHQDDDDDNDGIPDTKDDDDDNDGIPDAQDDDKDSDGDGIPDHKDDDDDNDGIPDSKDNDDDNDGIPDTKDTDHPNNTQVRNQLADDIDKERDTDGDGTPDHLDDDDDNDGIPDAQDKDDDGDGIPDSQERDTDGDGIPDDLDKDDDNDGIPDAQDKDDDGDGIPDSQERDTDGDGIPDDLDQDDDNDGIPDTLDNDDDGDGIPDAEDNDDDGDDENEFIRIQNDDKTFNLTRVVSYKESEMSGDTKIVCELHIPGTTYRLKKSVHVYADILSTTTETQIQSEFDCDNVLATNSTKTDDTDNDDDDDNSDEDNGSWQQLPGTTMLMVTFLLVLMGTY